MKGAWRGLGEDELEDEDLFRDLHMPLRGLLYPSGALEVYDLRMRRARLRFFWEGIILRTQSKDYYTLPEDRSWCSAQEPLMV